MPRVRRLRAAASPQRNVPRPVALVALVTLAALGAACAQRGRPGRAEPSTAVARAVAIPLRVENGFRADVVIYAAQGAARRRLGTVTAFTTQELAVPAAFVGDLGGFHLVADPVAGGGALRSEAVAPQPGQRLVWSLASRLSRSVLAVQ